MHKPQSVSICIVTYNNADKIGDAVASISRHTKLPYTLYISDNGSTDNTVGTVLSANPDAVILQNGKNIGFGQAHNKVLTRLNSEYHVVVNPDISFNYDVISEICEYLDNNPEVVLAAPKILTPGGAEQILPKRRPKLKYLAARRLHLSRRLADEYAMADVVLDKPTEVDFCSGCFFVIRTEIFKKLSGFDDRFFMYFEDADLTLRTKQYGKTMFLPALTVTHAWEKSSAKSLKYFFIHFGSMLKFFWKYRGKKDTINENCYHRK